jgi:hypothetical protein
VQSRTGPYPITPDRLAPGARLLDLLLNAACSPRRRLRFAPCLPADWAEFKVHYRYRETAYHITVSRTSAATL